MIGLRKIFSNWCWYFIIIISYNEISLLTVLFGSSVYHYYFIFLYSLLFSLTILYLRYVFIFPKSQY